MVFQRELIKQRALGFLSAAHHQNQSPKSMEKLNQPQSRPSRRVFQRYLRTAAVEAEKSGMPD
jgi:hypothetical protein